jgi:DNA invertase Pin-like site-specific DNA recombinase
MFPAIWLCSIAPAGLMNAQENILTGRRGNGFTTRIAAQRDGLERFAAAEGFELVRVYVEIETGKGSDALDRRPQLAAALNEARRQRCAVAVAKLDRLSRDVHFIFGFSTVRLT